MKKDYSQLAQRLFNTPLAIVPGKIEIVMAALADRFGLAKVFRLDGSTVMLDSTDIGPERSTVGYTVISGIAITPVTGTLVQKSGSLHPWCGMTGYDGIRANLGMALADKSVRAIALDIDSPGGEVAGCFDLVDFIYQARGVKPIWSILTESAYSAAYAIASSTDKIIVPRSGGTGSVGVICAHVDMSKALGAAGLNVTLIIYGDRKADGNEFNPLSDKALARFQADVDAIGDLFVETVARNRKLPVSRVRGTQAATYLGVDGVKIGFADAVMAPDEAFQSLFEKHGK